MIAAIIVSKAGETTPSDRRAWMQVHLSDPRAH